MDQDKIWDMNLKWSVVPMAAKLLLGNMDCKSRELLMKIRWLEKRFLCNNFGDLIVRTERRSSSHSAVP
jgi:hypothetical protein